jgi:excisionase family DNA binding protein
MNAVRMLAIKDAAALAGVTRRTIYNWIRAGKLQHRRTAGGRIRIDADSLFRSPLMERAHDLPPFPLGPLLNPTDRGRL